MSRGGILGFNKWARKQKNNGSNEREDEVPQGGTSVCFEIIVRLAS